MSRLQNIKLTFKSYLVMSFCFLLISCDKSQDSTPMIDIEPEVKDYKLPNIDLSNWKVTLPIGDPIEVSPPEIKNYATNEVLKPYMYNDSVAGALVFYATPGATTANTSYSRSELREQMVPGSNSINWTFAQGGNMRGTLSMGAVTKDVKGDYHKVIIMQIHGRLSNVQRDLIGAKDNNGPPVLKIYWEKGKVKVATKKLKDPNASELEILDEDAWTDQSRFFSQSVDFDRFTLEVNVTNGVMKVTLNDLETFTYDDDNMKRWGVFENYFKAGNYLNTLDVGASAKVNYFDLKVKH